MARSTFISGVYVGVGVSACLALTLASLGMRIDTGKAPPRVIEAETIRLVDDVGTLRGEWTVKSGAAAMTLFDREARPRLRAAVGSYPMVTFIDEQGVERIEAFSESSAETVIRFRDEQDVARLSARLARDVTLSLARADGTTGVLLSISAKGVARLISSDSEGKVLWNSPQEEPKQSK